MKTLVFMLCEVIAYVICVNLLDAINLNTTIIFFAGAIFGVIFFTIQLKVL